MSIWEALAVLAAGIGAGTINTIVGSGTLITFPVLLATGLPPITANVSNALGLVPGSISGAIGYRAELKGQKRRILRLGGAALLGGLIGAILLLALPSDAFDAIVPILIGLALVLVLLQPRIAAAVKRRREQTGTEAHPDGGPVLLGGLFLASMYGGYFGAAQGVLYLSLMGLLLHDNLQRINAVKNILGALASHSGSSDRSLARIASSIASAGVGSNGWCSSGIPACSGVRSALRWLSSAQDATVFSQVSPPPCARGTTWSTVVARRPQYAHRCWSRTSTPRLDHGACLRNGTRTYRQSLITRGTGRSTAAPRTRRSGWACSTTALSVRTRTTARLRVTVDSGSKLALSTSVSRIVPTSRVQARPRSGAVGPGSTMAGPAGVGQRNISRATKDARF